MKKWIYLGEKVATMDSNSSLLLINSMFKSFELMFSAFELECRTFEFKFKTFEHRFCRGVSEIIIGSGCKYYREREWC